MQFYFRFFFGVAAVLSVTAAAGSKSNEDFKLKQIPTARELFTAIKILFNARERLLSPKDYKTEVTFLREIQFLLERHVRKYVEEREENFTNMLNLIRYSSLNDKDQEQVYKVWKRLDFALVNHTHNEAFKQLEVAIEKILEGLKGGKIKDF